MVYNPWVCSRCGKHKSGGENLAGCIDNEGLIWDYHNFVHEDDIET
jgi:hypothetical protein